MRAIVCLAALAGTCGVAAAIDPIAGIPPTLLQPGQYTITGVPLDSGTGGLFNPGDAPATRYEGSPGPYSAFAAGTFSRRDDYTTDSPLGSDNLLDKLVFIGGVTAVGGVLEFFFLDTGDHTVGSPTVISSFGVAFPSAGDFIWTISFSPAFRPTLLSSGGLHVQNAAGTTGRWFMTTTLPTIGTNSVAVGSASTLSPPRNHAFAFSTLPTPGSLCLLGLAGIAAGRRRR